MTLIGVAGRDEASTFQQWVTDRGVDGFDHISDPDIEVWREFGITTQPAFVFIDDDGTVESRFGGMGQQGLSERIEELVAN